MKAGEVPRGPLEVPEVVTEGLDLESRLVKTLAAEEVPREYLEVQEVVTEELDLESKLAWSLADAELESEYPMIAKPGFFDHKAAAKPQVPHSQDVQEEGQIAQLDEQKLE